MTIDLHSAPLAIAIGALCLSAASPAGLIFLQRRAHKKDNKSRLELEDAHRREIAADAVKVASQRLLTASIEQELQIVENAIHIIQATIKLKLDMGEIVLPETNISLAALLEQSHALEVELLSRKESNA